MSKGVNFDHKNLLNLERSHKSQSTSLKVVLLFDALNIKKLVLIKINILI